MGNPDLTTPVTPTSPAGSYPIHITRGTLTAGNYDFLLVDGTLTVTQTNRPPIATVRLDASTPEKHDILIATATKADADGDPVRLTFVWKVNGEVLDLLPAPPPSRTGWTLSAEGQEGRPHRRRGDALRRRTQPGRRPRRLPRS